LTQFRNVLCHQAFEGDRDDHLLFWDMRTDPVD
jgi:hypothetical protein